MFIIHKVKLVFSTLFLNNDNLIIIFKNYKTSKDNTFNKFKSIYNYIYNI